MASSANESRRLAAIMFIDMVGYSALMQQSEARAIAAVRDLWDLVRPILTQHGGLEIDLAGDGMLMEFSGALSAVRCALSVQDALHARNAPVPEAERIRARAGIHLGDIEHRDNRIYGDGINIAARLLALSPAGAVTMSAPVRDQLLNVLDYPLHRLGLRRLKNIKHPMELWCLAGPDCKPADITAAQREDEGARCWTFADIRFDGKSFELTRGGQPVALDKKSLDVLTFLLHHAGEVVTKEEILGQAWPGRNEAEASVDLCIGVLRQALDDPTQALIKDVHGFGYRFAAPVQVESVASGDGLRHFDFKPGDKPPLRPTWSLVERLGSGGHGEAWLARHDKTRELRVFKFALDASALTSLKREITLYRVLKDSLGTRREYVQILDWNLEEMPYFLECEHWAGGNLAQWAQAQGGLLKLPITTRLDIAAQIAEALAAAHSVGVLHKDLKPSNVLMETQGDETPRVKLADFGSGGVVDSQRLEELGITRMGFTRTIMDLSDTTSGTPIYMAPEVIAGQPFTVQSDIYALGVILYQLAVGSFGTLLSPGWERDIPDALIREDIALAAEGHAEERLADAAELARRLRSLNQRRREQDERRQQQAREQQARAIHERFKRLRWVATSLLALTVATSVAGFSAYKARNRAQVAEAEARKAETSVSTALVSAQAVNDFLTKDLLASLDPGTRAAADLKATDFLDIAAGKVDSRLAAQPLAAAEVHFALGTAYRKLGVDQQWLIELQKAAELFEKVLGRDAEPTLNVLFKIGVAKRNLGDYVGALEQQEEVIQRRTRLLGPDHLDVVLNRLELAAAKGEFGNWTDAIAEDRAVLEIWSPIKARKNEIWLTKYSLADALSRVAEYEEADKLEREVIEGLRNEPDTVYLTGPRVSTNHAFLLIQRGRFDEAAQFIASLEIELQKQLPAGHYVLSDLSYARASLMAELGKADEAIALMESLQQRSIARHGSGKDVAYKDLWRLAATYTLAGRHSDAISAWRKVISIADRTMGVEHPDMVFYRAQLATALYGSGDKAEALKVLDGISPKALSRLPPRHPHLAELRRAQALLWLDEGKRTEARTALAEVLDIYQYRLGPDHWRTRRASAELARVVG